MQVVIVKMVKKSRQTKLQRRRDNIKWYRTHT